MGEILSESNLKVLKKCSLFAGILDQELKAILACLGAVNKAYVKNQYIYTMGQEIKDVGIIVNGAAFIEKIDCWGNRTILAKVMPGDMFGEALACASVVKSSINVVTSEETTVLFIDYRKIVNVCSSACTFHTSLIENMLKILAQKNIMLTGKIEHLTKRSTREKLLSYLSSIALQKGSKSFDIMLNRQELADYLAVDRSAMSHELGKMRNEGILDFNKNHFILHDFY